MASPPSHRALVEDPDAKGLWISPTPHLVVGEVKRWAEKAGVLPVRIPGYWMEKEGSDREIGEAPRSGEKVLYHLHGGAYAHGSAYPKDLTANVPRGVVEYTPSVLRAFSIEYRLSKGLPLYDNENPFPAALIDAIAGYNYLVNVVRVKPENIIVSGDSAGGNLALALVRFLLDNQTSEVEIPHPPGELLLFSPWSDVGDSDVKPGLSMFTNIPYDYLNITSRARTLPSKLNFLGPHGFEEANMNRYISPASTAETMEPVSFKGFPRTLIISGGAEVLRDQIRVLRDKMVADMGEGQIQYLEAAASVHDYVVFKWHEPERSETLRVVADWITS